MSNSIVALIMGGIIGFMICTIIFAGVEMDLQQKRIIRCVENYPYLHVTVCKDIVSGGRNE